MLQFKEGNGWKCCYDPETGRYTAQLGGGVNCEQRREKRKAREQKSKQEGNSKREKKQEK